MRVKKILQTSKMYDGKGIGRLYVLSNYSDLIFLYELGREVCNRRHGIRDSKTGDANEERDCCSVVIDSNDACLRSRVV